MARKILIAGGGVAALEAVLALNALAEERLDIELVGPEPHFWYRPLSVAEPFELGEAQRFELGALTAAAGATFVLGALQGVDAGRREAQTSVGAMPYDALLIAVGAEPTEAIPGALTFRGPADTDRIRALLAELAAGYVRRVVFAAPWGAVWSLPLYELVLMTAGWLGAHGVQGVELSIVTPEQEPLQLFGPAASAAVKALLEERGIDVVTSSSVTELDDGHVRLARGGRLEADRVVALPRLRGSRFDGLPQTLEGFIPVDAHGRVRGLADVYAAGDITSFPVKQGGIATQLADAVAETIAARFGADLVPEPFRPVLRGLLLTGGRPTYLRRELTGVSQVEAVSTDPLWWPPAKIVGRYLAPFLADAAGVESPPEPSAVSGIEIDVELDAEEVADLAEPRFETDDDATVGELMLAELLVVSSTDTLGAAAGSMRASGTGSAAVVEDGRLVGILTSRDLLRALAALTDLDTARVVEWMTAEPVSVSAETGAAAAVATMDERGIHQLLVVDGDRLLGMLGYRQAVRAMRTHGIGLGF